MMYDDIVDNPQNKSPGSIISAVPELGNVYPGVPKDYTGKEVTPKNFLAALQGQETSKKIIESGKDDTIFIYMSTTGGRKTFAFPELPLPAADLIRAIDSMYKNNKFSKMVIYMDSDYSATMLNHLSQYNNVYAVSSCDENNKNISTGIDLTLGVSLSDQFSSAVLKFIHTAKYDSATFKNLFDNLSKTVKSNPSQFGDTEIRDGLLSVFLKN